MYKRQYQDKSKYAISGTTLTFATAPQNGYNVEVMVLGAISASTNALYTDTFTGDGSQTAYALGITPVDLNAIDVYLNGLYQNVSTLSLSANTVTFATAPPSGVIIEIRSVGFLNSGGTLSPATLTGGTGINVTTNSPNNFTIANTLGGGIDWDTTIQTATFSGNPGRGYIVNTTAGEVTLNLPAGAAGNIVAVQDYAGTFATNNLILSANGSEKIQGTTNNFKCATDNATVTLIYQDATKGWTADNIREDLELTVSYLVVAGGGAGGGSGFGGGGGAGGYLTNYGGTAITLAISTSYPVTIGAGGSGGSSSGQAPNGSSSVFNTITAIGGGGGGAHVQNGASGASGGGGGGDQPTSGGTGSNGNNGGVGYDPAPESSGGGGGFGTVGQAGLASGSGAGGAGEQNNIDGNNNFYAAGGGGGLGRGDLVTTTPAAGGSSIGGNGGISKYYGSGGSVAASPTVGTTNTGSGGGGGHPSNAAGSPGGANGGNGIVILRYPSVYTIVGLSGTTTTVGTDKVTKFLSGTGNIQFN